MTNINNIKIPYIFSISVSNGCLDFDIISQYKRVTYIENIACKAKFIFLTNVFIA